jgi:hypothetical protein
VIAGQTQKLEHAPTLSRRRRATPFRLRLVADRAVSDALLLRRLVKVKEK